MRRRYVICVLGYFSVLFFMISTLGLKQTQKLIIICTFALPPTYFTPFEFFPPALMVQHFSLIHTKSSQISGKVLSILVNLEYVVVWIVAFLSLIFNSSILSSKSLWTVPCETTTTGTTVTFIFHNLRKISNKDQVWYLSLPPTREHLTQGQKPEGRLKWGWRGGEGRERVEARTLLVYAANWPIKCNVGLMSQAVSWTKIWARARMPGYSLD